MKRYLIGAALGAILAGSLTAHATDTRPQTEPLTANQRVSLLCRVIQPDRAFRAYAKACPGQVRYPLSAPGVETGPTSGDGV